MKKFIFTLAFVFLFASSYSAHANIYVAPRVSYAKQVTDAAVFIEKNTFDGTTVFDFNTSMFSGAFALGYDFYTSSNIPLRLEGEFTYFTDAKAVDAKELYSSAGNKVKTIQANIYYDLNRKGNTIPYINAGLGLSLHTPYVELLAESFEDDTMVSIATNVGLGVSQKLTEKLMLEAGYRFSFLGLPEQSTYPSFGICEPYFVHQFMAGLRINF